VTTQINLEYYRDRVEQLSLAAKLNDADITKLALMMADAYEAGQYKVISTLDKADKFKLTDI
jgi:hypothetical protein